MQRRWRRTVIQLHFRTSHLTSERQRVMQTVMQRDRQTDVSLSVSVNLLIDPSRCAAGGLADE